MYMWSSEWDPLECVYYGCDVHWYNENVTKIFATVSAFDEC